MDVSCISLIVRCWVTEFDEEVVWYCSTYEGFGVGVFNE